MAAPEDINIPRQNLKQDWFPMHPLQIDEDLSSEEDYSPESSWEPDECTLLSPSQSDLEVIETIETTV